MMIARIQKYSISTVGEKCLLDLRVQSIAELVDECVIAGLTEYMPQLPAIILRLSKYKHIEGIISIKCKYYI